MAKVIRARIAAHLIGGEVIDSGDLTITEQELHDEPGADFDGRRITKLEEIVPMFELMLEKWDKMDTLTIRLPDGNSRKIRVPAIAYIEGYARLEDDDAVS